MKLLKFTSLVFTFFSLVFCVNTLQASSNVESNKVAFELNDAVLGTWAYSVPDVDPAYSKGVMHITKASGAYVVNIELPGGTLTTVDVEVKDDEVKFALYIEGSRVEVKVLVDGDKLTGSGTSEQGPFTLAGTRMI
ncbi:hypothetical protein JQC67_08780 [Aurantibacter crassamenti]|uniref:hypothetical protein n=1 Tax=Aurantibacter crassamenti TaxID=1837375 RepID=UPI00193A92D2|nr:hypothetical protein [Aurantibacter crassamenti]MBM1106228.1 hypothetical protein [Aurantibacter crassamenti]